MADIKLDYSKVESYCNELHGIAKNMKVALENIYGINKKLYASDSWSGQASDNYSKKLNNIANNFDEIFKETEYSILYLAAASDGYKAIDENIRKEICNNLNINSNHPTLSQSKMFSGIISERDVEKTINGKPMMVNSVYYNDIVDESKDKRGIGGNQCSQSVLRTLVRKGFIEGKNGSFYSTRGDYPSGNSMLNFIANPKELKKYDGLYNRPDGVNLNTAIFDYSKSESIEQQFKAAINEYGTENIVFSFKHGDNSSVGYNHGHTLYIRSISDGLVYFTDNWMHSKGVVGETAGNAIRSYVWTEEQFYNSKYFKGKQGGSLEAQSLMIFDKEGE